MKNPYQTLGIDPSATAAEIKAAWRKLCTQHHPDKEGGDPAAMAEINAAYEILSSPQRRLAFDEGRDGEPTMEDLAVEMLSHIFGQLIERDDVVDLVTAAGSTLEKLRFDASRSVKRATGQIDALTKRMKRLKSKHTFVHDLAAKKIAAAQREVNESTEALKIVEASVVMLKDFEFEPEPVKPQARGTFQDPDWLPSAFYNPSRMW